MANPLGAVAPEARRLYDRYPGLSCENIVHLHNIALAEQGSTKQRGGFITGLVVSIGVAVIVGDITLNTIITATEAAFRDFFKSLDSNYGGLGGYCFVLLLII